VASFYLRPTDLVVVAHQNRCVFIRPGRPPFVHEPCDAVSISKALEALCFPRELTEIEDTLDLRLLALLTSQGFILSASERAKLPFSPADARTDKRPCGRLVFGVTGAIGALNVVPLVGHLYRHFAERIDVVLTSSACRIVEPNAFRHLGVETWTDAFEVRGEINVPHIELASADVLVIAPASAHTIYKLAHGACSDLLSLVVAATRAPIVVAPSMNGAMWSNPAIVENVTTLRRRGFWIVEPGLGLEVSRRAEARWEFGAADLEAGPWLEILAAILQSRTASGIAGEQQ
jgi:phosphopantothenoylcysteine decarboxylase / phosphopantothenate---cysteine ligase